MIMLILGGFLAASRFAFAPETVGWVCFGLAVGGAVVSGYILLGGTRLQRPARARREYAAAHTYENGA